GCGCGKYFEIWNDVFIQYNKNEQGNYTPLKMKTVDTGMGVERTIAMLQGKSSVYDTELFEGIISSIEEASGRKYGSDEETDHSIRIITDHIRSSVFILGDEKGVKPSNLGQGYILRRLIRRAIRHSRKLSIEGNFLKKAAFAAIDIYKVSYPELIDAEELILKELETEEERFLKTLKKGEHEFEKLLPALRKNPRAIIPGRIAFRLYDTYGFPIELTKELAAEQGLAVDLEGFRKAFKKHQELSKQGAAKSFKGGLADTTEMTRKLHTATHLLHQALRLVLGDHVEQKGSNITAERLRFDFTHHEKMTDRELREVEKIVNQQIEKDLPVSFQTLTLKEAIG
ncbi:hypothetical protein LCGC14_3126040, partial [marine sediment metagenome]